MRALIPLAVLLVLSASVLGQDEGYVITGHFDRFTTDELGNVYAIQGDELVLYDTKGRSWLRNSLKTFGRITSIDAFYSLKPMVHAKELGQVAVLDNTLAVQGSVINLPRNGFTQVVLACMSVQNSFWFYDQREMALLRVDAQLRPLANTGRLDQLLGFTPEPLAMHELDSRLYVNDPAHGVLVFDIFGTYMRTIPIPGIRSFEVGGGGISYLDGQGAWRYDMRSFEIAPLPLEHPAGAVRELRMERGMLYLLLDDRIAVSPVAVQER